MAEEIFSGTWVLVTGASSGLGEEFARQLAHLGANLVLTARSRVKLESLASDLARVNGIGARVVIADLAQPGGAEYLARSIDELGISIDHVVNNAGFGMGGPFATGDALRQAQLVRVNVESLVLLSRHFLPGMLQRRRGGIINVASTAGYQPTPFMAVYAASKAFVLSVSTALASEVAGSGVRVLACCPGPVPTGFQVNAGISPDSLLRIAKLEPNRVVRRTLAAYVARHVVYVPGLVNALQTKLARLLPRSFVVHAARFTMKRLGRV